jgi:hypothetical protein
MRAYNRRQTTKENLFLNLSMSQLLVDAHEQCSARLPGEARVFSDGFTDRLGGRAGALWFERASAQQRLKASHKADNSRGCNNGWRGRAPADPAFAAPVPRRSRANASSERTTLGPYRSASAKPPFLHCDQTYDRLFRLRVIPYRSPLGRSLAHSPRLRSNPFCAAATKPPSTPRRAMKMTALPICSNRWARWRPSVAWIKAPRRASSAKVPMTRRGLCRAHD